MRICSTCGEEYSCPEGNFTINGLSKAGRVTYRSSCKKCEVFRQKRKRVTHPHLKANQRASRQKHKDLIEAKAALTEIVLCHICSKVFALTVLPEKAGSISLICSSCLSTVQQHNINEEISYER